MTSFFTRRDKSVLATATDAQQTQLGDQMRLVFDHQQSAKAAGDVLFALLRMVYPAFDPAKHQYHAATGKVTALPPKIEEGV